MASLIQPPPVIRTVLQFGQGPAGPAGRDNLTSLSYPAHGSISGHKVVHLRADGRVAVADSSLEESLGTIQGITENAASDGDPILIAASGLMVHSGWSWAIGPVFLGTSGSLTQSLPPGSIFMQVIGFAQSATSLVINLQPPFRVG